MLAAWLIAGTAFARPEADPAAPSLLLEWSGPGPELDCLGEEGLKAAVNDYLGRDAFGASADLVLRVSVDRLPDRRFHAVLEVLDATERVLGKREITSPTELCSSFDDRLVLAVALLADEGPEPPAPAPVPAAPRAEEPVRSAPGGEPERPEPPPEAPTPRRALEFGAEAALVVESGLLPAVRPGVSAGSR